MKDCCFVAKIDAWEPDELLAFINCHLGDTMYLVVDYGGGCAALKRELKRGARNTEDDDDIHFKWCVKNVEAIFRAARPS